MMYAPTNIKVVLIYMLLHHIPWELHAFSPSLNRAPNEHTRRQIHYGRRPLLKSTSTTLLSSYDEDGFRERAQEAVRSLCDYHIGTWKGRTFSFSVTPDVAAGVIQRTESPNDYKVSVNFGATTGSDNDAGKKPEFALTETYSWDDTAMVRSLPLQHCRFDVDEVDASYSLDERRLQSGGGNGSNTNMMLPSVVSGILAERASSSSSASSFPACQLVVEHCIASGENRRMRCFALYGTDSDDDEDESDGGGGGRQKDLSLIRVIVGQEERVDNSQSDIISSRNIEPNAMKQSQGLTAADLLEMQSDVDRLVDKISASIQGGAGPSLSPPSSAPQPSQMDRLTDSLSTNQNGTQQLQPHNVSLLEISSGVWLGDAVIRSRDNVPMSATPPGRGFGSPTKTADDTYSSKEKQEFGNWAVGVQKLALRWMWNFGDDMRQIVDVGKALGSPLGQPLVSPLAGGVYVDESLSRRVPKSQRMVYIGYPTIDSVGFLVGCFSVNVPRYITIKDESDSASTTGGRPQKPFFTEFAVFQEADGDQSAVDDASSKSPGRLVDVFCSKSQRLYNHYGDLKQGVTSFYTFSRFGGENGEEGDDDLEEIDVDDDGSILDAGNGDYFL